VSELRDRYRRVRARTEALCAPLTIEDHVVQAFADASPAKWHLAHTTWFFETFVLRDLGVKPLHPAYDFLFNSYYDAVGARVPREARGTLSRPTVEEVRAYRRHVDERVLANLDRGLGDRIELGLHHEQQHQELLLTDIKAAFAANPLRPAYRDRPLPPSIDPGPVTFVQHDGGVASIGHEGDAFAFDNERPRHRVFLEPFSIAHRPATNGELLAFVEDRGYERPELWLSDGFAVVRTRGWRAPHLWERLDGGFQQMTLGGIRPLDLDAPACHLSYYEADAFARWSHARLPTEAEWEISAPAERDGNFADDDYFHPRSARTGQWFGDVWEWTQSAYASYPGFAPLAGALGEYNGKFMSGQMVLRGGSCATPRDHIRATYRNFFPPDARWQFTGVRLAR
jgi:ergothioneine biosynthesis protein EgtB